LFLWSGALLRPGGPASAGAINVLRRGVRCKRSHFWSWGRFRGGWVSSGPRSPGGVSPTLSTARPRCPGARNCRRHSSRRRARWHYSAPSRRPGSSAPAADHSLTRPLGGATTVGTVRSSSDSGQGRRAASAEVQLLSADGERLPPVWRRPTGDSAPGQLPRRECTAALHGLHADGYRGRRIHGPNRVGPSGRDLKSPPGNSDRTTGPNLRAAGRNCRPRA
jgi:hypothetical protein